MAIKWSAVSISGYGASSPADDGSATEANRVKYSTIKTDLTNPLNTALGTTLSRLTDVFDDAPIAKSGAYTTTASDHARTIESTGSFTLSLLDASTGGTGYRVKVKNAGTGTVTVERTAADTIDGATSYALGPKESATFEVNQAGNGYNVDRGSPGLLFSSGDQILFRGSATPAGWSIVAQNDKALRIVSGSPSSGGTNAFSTAFNSSRTTGAGGSHSHGVGTLSGSFTTSTTGGAGGGVWVLGGSSQAVTISGTTAAEASHTHSINLAVRYYDMNLIEKS